MNLSEQMINAALSEAEVSRQRFLKTIRKENPEPIKQKVPESTSKMSFRELALLLTMLFTGR